MDPETYMSYVKAGKLKFDPSKLPEGMKSRPDGSEPNQYGCNPNWEEHSNPKSSDYKTKYECELHGYKWDRVVLNVLLQNHQTIHPIIKKIRIKLIILIKRNL